MRISGEKPATATHECVGHSSEIAKAIADELQAKFSPNEKKAIE
jgi:hypothetical protein